MAPHDLAALVEQLGLRRLEGPDECRGVVGVGLADVDLDTTSLEREEQDGVRRGLQIPRDGHGARGCALGARCSAETPDEGDGSDYGEQGRSSDHGIFLSTDLAGPLPRVTVTARLDRTTRHEGRGKKLHSNDDSGLVKRGQRSYLFRSAETR